MHKITMLFSNMQHPSETMWRILTAKLGTCPILNDMHGHLHEDFYDLTTNVDLASLSVYVYMHVSVYV